ncbi:cell growth regulator with EF hand domain protein 1-like [Ornithodoros turicata]|uniref:cell growth regulator with EF hand domain protein 1-like n=1 Tax=Ornithodoros turicata TaxID=34597 RepID=UPI003139A3CF
MTNVFVRTMAATNVAAVVLLVAMMPLVVSHGTERNLKKDAEEKVKAIREKYGAFRFIRDLDHLKEDYAHIAELHIDGTLSSNEAIFYFFRMHDFDDNGLLDGLELLAATMHVDHMSPENVITLEEFIEGVDTTLEADKDLDGFLNYGELLAFQNEMEKRRSASGT